MWTTFEMFVGGLVAVRLCVCVRVCVFVLVRFLSALIHCSQLACGAARSHRVHCGAIISHCRSVGVAPPLKVLGTYRSR